MANTSGCPTTGVAQVAVQSGRHAADTIRRRLAGDPTRRPFRYRNLGTMATISRLRAIAVLGRVRLAGLPAWGLWPFVHLTTLTGFTNRLSVPFTGRSRSWGADARNESSPHSRFSRATRSKCTHMRAAVRHRWWRPVAARTRPAERERMHPNTPTTTAEPAPGPCPQTASPWRRPAGRGYGREDLERAGEYRVFEDPVDLLKHLDEVGGRS